jgi:hypothetical protein
LCLVWEPPGEGRCGNAAHHLTLPVRPVSLCFFPTASCPILYDFFVCGLAPTGLQAPPEQGLSWALPAAISKRLTSDHTQCGWRPCGSESPSWCSLEGRSTCLSLQISPLHHSCLADRKSALLVKIRLCSGTEQLGLGNRNQGAQTHWRICCRRSHLLFTFKNHFS